MLRIKDTDKLIKKALRALPDVPYLTTLRRRRRASVASYVLGAVSVAIAGGIAAVMILSPRTRDRTLGMARESYGRLRGQLGQLGIGERIEAAQRDESIAAGAYAGRLDPESHMPSHAIP